MIILIEEDIKPFQSETHTNTCSRCGEQYIECNTHSIYMCVPEQVMEESPGVSADGVSVLEYDSV